MISLKAWLVTPVPPMMLWAAVVELKFTVPVPALKVAPLLNVQFLATFIAAGAVRVPFMATL